MKREEYRLVPGGFGDPFRAIDVLPGLVPIVTGLPYFYVRGAPPAAVGFYVDEVRVPFLFHFALGPGVVHPALVEEVSVHPAAAPARYGRYAGGVVAGTTRDPSADLRGEGNVRIFDAGAYVEAPFGQRHGGAPRGWAGVGGRYSYTAALLSLIADEAVVDYRDYNARVVVDLDDRFRFTAFTLGAFDYAGQDRRDGTEDVVFASEFHRLDLRLDHRGKDGSFTRVATTLGIDRTALSGVRFAQDVLTALRARHERRLGAELDLEVGADVTGDTFAGHVPSRWRVSHRDYRTAQNLFAPRTDTATGVWISGRYHPRPGWEIVGAMRGDVFTSAGVAEVGPSPRLSSRVPLGPRLAFLAAMGIAAQPPAFTIPIPAVGFRGLPGGLSFAYQKSAGFEARLPLRFTLRTVGYHHTYENLRSFAENRRTITRESLEEPVLGTQPTAQSFGLEVRLTRAMGERFSAFASATISRTQVASTPSTPATLGAFDRAYVVQLGGALALGAGWMASSRVVTYGGWPIQAADHLAEPAGARDTSDRLGGMLRLDLRVEKRWRLGATSWIAVVFEGLNVTGSTEVVKRECDEVSCRDAGVPLVIPSVGAEGGL